MKLISLLLLMNLLRTSGLRIDAGDGLRGEYRVVPTSLLGLLARVFFLQ